MLLRFWMILVIAIYPVLLGAGAWTSSTCRAPIGAVGEGCCASSDAASAMGQPEAGRAGCCALREPAGCTAPRDVERDCPLRGYCQGPCRTLPVLPVAPPLHRDNQFQSAKGPELSAPLFPLLATIAEPFGRPVSDGIPRVLSVSERLSTLCIRTT
jgi:hypothetical protein